MKWSIRHTKKDKKTDIPSRNLKLLSEEGIITSRRYKLQLHKQYFDTGSGNLSAFKIQYLVAALLITDINNNILSPDDSVGPETKIVAPNNNPLYIFGQISGIVGTIISIAALVLSLIPLQ